MRSKKKSSNWECKFNCDNSQTPCRHLQSLLPAVDAGNVRQQLLPEIQQEWYENTSSEYDENEIVGIRNTLISVGLSMDQATLLIDRFIHDMPIDQIAKKSGYIDNATVYYFLNQTMKSLKALGLEHIKALFEREKDE